jgi:PTH1 family peptidyl-tRNA hydrolase
MIVGLGNPGPQYEATRHNAGFWFVEALARRQLADLRKESKFKGWVARTIIDGNTLWLLMPDTFMNRSGQAAQVLANFYKIPVEQILVVHDELDLPPGTARLKQGGGHGGHNGLRDLIEKLGSKDFYRLRIGIGHPGHKSQVHNYVLNRPPEDERISMERTIDDALAVMPLILQGEWQKAMNELHSK